MFRLDILQEKEQADILIQAQDSERRQKMRKRVAVIAILSIFTLCHFAAAAEQKAVAGGRTTSPLWNLPSGIKTISVNGYPMAYMEQGSGPIVVLVHGS